MLVLSRKKYQGVQIRLTAEQLEDLAATAPKLGHLIDVSVVRIAPNQVRLGITAPHDVVVHRSEVQEQIDREVLSGK